MTHDELRELTGGYALGVLSDEDRRALEAHLAECDECAREVRELTGVAAGLAVAVPQVDPPVALRARVLRAAVGSELPAGVRPAPLPVPVPLPAPLPTWMTAFAAAAAIAAVALGLYALSLRERVGRLEEQLRQANARAEGVERELQIARSSHDRIRQIALVLEAGDVRTIDLVGQKGAPGATGRCYWSPSRGLVVTATNLPEPAAGRQYQVWVIPTGSNPVSAGMLEQDASGPLTALVDPATAARAGTVAITLERAGGAPQPTTDPLLVASW